MNAIRLAGCFIFGLLTSLITQAQSLDLFIDSEVDFVEPGTHLAQRIWVVNSSAQTASAVEIDITIPAHSRVWSPYTRPAPISSGGYQSEGDIITVALGDMAPGAIRAVSFPMQLLSSAVVGETIDLVVDSNFSDPVARPIVIVAEDALQLAITADKQAVVPGELFTLSVFVANPSEAGVARSELKLDLDEDIEILSSSFPAGSVVGDEITVSLGTIPGNAVYQYYIRARLEAGETVNTFHPISGQAGGRVDDEFGGATLQILGLDSVPARLTVETDEPYTFTVHNQEGSRLEDGMLHSHIPQNARVWGSYVQPVQTSGGSGYLSASDRAMAWQLPDIFTGDPYYIQMPIIQLSDTTFAHVQRNELLVGNVVLPADAPWIRASQWGGTLSLDLRAPEPVSPSEVFFLQVYFGNPAGDNAEDAVLTLQLPDDVSLQDSSISLTDLGNGLHSVELGNIRPGESDMIWLRLMASSDFPLENQYGFSAWLTDSSLPMKTAYDRYVVQAYEAFPMKLNFLTAKQSLNENSQFLAELEVTNTSAFPLTDLRVAMNAPTGIRVWQGYTFPQASSGSGYASRADPAFWDIPVLDAGETRVISMPWALNQAVPGWWHGLQAVVTTTEGYSMRTRVVTAANTAHDLNLLIQPEKAISPGETTFLTVTYANRGDSASLNPTISIMLPPGIGYVDSDVQPVAVDPVLRFNLSSMNPGDRGRIRIEVAADPELDATRNTHVFGRMVDQSTPVNSALAETSLLVREAEPLVLELTGHSDPSGSGGLRQMEILVNNTTNETIENLTLWFLVPDFTATDPDWVQPFGGAGGRIDAGEWYRYDLAVLPPQEPLLLSVPFEVRSGTAGWIAPITAHVTTESGLYARDMEHFVFDTGTLRLEMIPLDDFAPVGGNLTYRVYVGNVAQEERESVVLRASIPESTTFVSASGGGVLDGSAVLWDVGTIPAGSVAYAEFSVQVSGSYPPGSILQNEAYVTDSESPRNTARAVTSIPAAQGETKLSMDADYTDSVFTLNLTNNTGLELASARAWFSMPRFSRLATQTSIGPGESVFWDLQNVVSDVAQELVAEIQHVGSPPDGHLIPLTGGAVSNLGFGVSRRHVVAMTDNLFPVDAGGLNPEIRQIWPDAESVEGGWVRSTWYGWFLEEDWPWIIHAEHGYQFPISNEFGVYLYDFFLGAWIFANQSNYFSDPNFALLYVYDDPDWLPMGFYRGGVAPNRWFYHYGPEYDRAMNESEFRPLLHPDDD